MKFLVAAPDYRENSAGVVVLHKLCHLLNQAGHEATVPCARRNPAFAYCDDLMSMPSNHLNFVIPEISHGAMYRGKVQRVIRYALNYPRFFDIGDHDFSQDDVVFTYVKKFYPSATEFFLTSVNTDLFKYDGCEKYIDCAWYVGKGKQHCDMTGIQFTQDFPSTRFELAYLMRRSKNFYSFDDNTAMTNEAIIAGCNSYVWKDGWFLVNGSELDISSKKDDDISIFLNEVMK